MLPPKMNVHRTKAETRLKSSQFRMSGAWFQWEHKEISKMKKIEHKKYG